ncbi:hypothetical protein C8255_08860 [filamentous cyanobacterium CCP3]|nr:hypothetical protein C8255_08860 [filamentous cyanobacterium CCP3]
MLECKWIIICEKSIRNGETGNISMIEVFDSLEIPPMPEIEPDHQPGDFFWEQEFDLVICWQKVDDAPVSEIPKQQQKFKLSVVSPHGDTILDGPLPNLPSDADKFISVFQFDGVPHPQEGAYSFEIHESENDKWIKKQSTWLKISIIEASDILEE